MSRVSTFFALTGSLCVAALALAAPALAQAPAAAPAASKPALMSTMRWAFVDMQAAILQTEEGKNAKAKIEKDAEAKRQDLLNQEKELKKLDDEFQAQQAVLSEDAKKAKHSEFQSKFQKLQGARMAFEQEVRQKEMQETQKIFQNLTSVIDDVAKRKGYEVVFERGAGAVLYAAKIDDITADVVTAYNGKHKVSKK
jgi:outer membrane protein